MILDYLIGKPGHRNWLWTFCVITFLIILIFEVIDFLTSLFKGEIMRKFNVWTLTDWPRRKNGELIFRDTNEAIYYAYVTDDRLAAYDLFKKWRKKNQQDIDFLKKKDTYNWNRLFDLACRGQFYRECMEEIERLNEEGK